MNGNVKFSALNPDYKMNGSLLLIFMLEATSIAILIFSRCSMKDCCIFFSIYELQ